MLKPGDKVEFKSFEEITKYGDTYGISNSTLKSILKNKSIRIVETISDSGVAISLEKENFWFPIKWFKEKRFALQLELFDDKT